MQFGEQTRSVACPQCGIMQQMDYFHWLRKDRNWLGRASYVSCDACNMHFYKLYDLEYRYVGYSKWSFQPQDDVGVLGELLDCYPRPRE